MKKRTLRYNKGEKTELWDGMSGRAASSYWSRCLSELIFPEIYLPPTFYLHQPAFRQKWSLPMPRFSGRTFPLVPIQTPRWSPCPWPVSTNRIQTLLIRILPILEVPPGWAVVLPPLRKDEKTIPYLLPIAPSSPSRLHF